MKRQHEKVLGPTLLSGTLSGRGLVEEQFLALCLPKYIFMPTWSFTEYKVLLPNWCECKQGEVNSVMKWAKFICMYVVQIMCFFCFFSKCRNCLQSLVI